MIFLKEDFMKKTPISLNENIIKELAGTKPVNALVELIYNSLDASATTIQIEIFRNKLSGVEKIIVQDNGEGIDPLNIHLTFAECGYSEKKQGDKNSLGKLVHGKKGRGRFKAYSLGSQIEWLSFNNQQKIKIQGDFSESKQFKIFSNEEITEDISQGTVFTAIVGARAPLDLSDDNKICADLETILSGTLEDSRISIFVNKRKLEVGNRIKNSQKIRLDEPFSDVEIRTIVWKTKSESNNRICWCNKDFQVLQEEKWKPEENKTQNSLYIASERIEKANTNGSLNLLALNASLSDILKQAKEKAAKYILETEKSAVYDIIDDFHRKKIHPYPNSPKSAVERKSKEVFDIILFEINRRAPGIFKRTKQETKLLLNTLKNAVEQDPDNVLKILQELLNLGTEDTKNLADLLNKVSMSNIIKTNKVIVDKLTFLHLLESYLAYGDTSKYILERSQLHKIIEKHLWIFGNQYELGTSDKTIDSIVQKIRESFFDKNNDSVNDSEGNTYLIPDLFLYRRIGIPTSQRRYHNLLIELKRPSVKIGKEEIRQVTDYADVIAKNERLKNYKWDIFILSSDIKDDEVASLVKDNKVLYSSENINIFTKTWKDIIDAQKWILDEYQQSLDVEISEELDEEYMNTHFKEIRSEIQRRRENALQKTQQEQL